MQIFNTAKISYYFPNAFTPNGDGKNDIFKGTGSGFIEGIQNYSLKIWNRWGDLCFESNNIEEGWDGRNKKSNRLATQGTYQFHAQFTLNEDKIHTFSGSILLLK